MADIYQLDGCEFFAAHYNDISSIVSQIAEKWLKIAVITHKPDHNCAVRHLQGYLHSLGGYSRVNE